MRDIFPFIRAILDQPDDDAPRLILADYLEERGSAQGEFIRIQCQRARLEHRDPQYGEALRREEEMLRVHRREWLRSWHAMLEPARKFPGFPLQYAEFRRGLVEVIRVDANAFVQHATDLMLLGPIRELALVVMVDETRAAGRLLTKLADLTCWPQLEVLGLRLWTWTGSAVSDFLAKIDLSRLRELHLYGEQIGSPILDPLLRWPGLSRLARVEVRTASPAGVGFLQNSPFRTLFGYPF
jgi:uncharacterized protein (TIGR02996 family)